MEKFLRVRLIIAGNDLIGFSPEMGWPTQQY